MTPVIDGSTVTVHVNVKDDWMIGMLGDITASGETNKTWEENYRR